LRKPINGVSLIDAHDKKNNGKSNKDA
jgi:hypothetical protein